MSWTCQNLTRYVGFNVIQLIDKCSQQKIYTSLIAVEV